MSGVTGNLQKHSWEGKRGGIYGQHLDSELVQITGVVE